MNPDDQMEEKKTLYTIVDEHGVRSTITIDKFAADILQEMIPDVHKWIQERYERVCHTKPHLTRREKGNIVRALAYGEVAKSPGLSDF